MPEATSTTAPVITEPPVVTTTTPPVVPPEVSELVQRQVTEALKPIKESLDSAYKARDEALKKVREFEQAQRDADLKKLQDEGKHREAFELQLAEEKTRREAAEARAVELTRDMSLRNALATKDFRSDNAREMAYREIVGQLVKDANGNWTHNTGLSIQDFVNGFAEKEDNAFLFKQKVSTGGGSTNINPPSTTNTNPSLFAKSQDEVLKLAAEGKLPRRR